ncbi:MAG TPA: MtrAB system histidine kinase MtrB [Kineosporiaceae bacterium]|nr:MtrAB system histidine kinase MtrB [Kineosporiaceae bacterium]
MPSQAHSPGQPAGPPAWRALPSRLRRAAGFAQRSLLGRWRRSVQLRVVSATVVLGVLVVLVVGQVLLQRITTGIITSREEAVKAQSHQDFQTMETNITATPYEKGNDVDTRITDLVNNFAAPADRPARYVIFQRAMDQAGGGSLYARASTGIDLSAIPQELRRAVDAEGSVEQEAQVFTTTLEGHSVPVIAVGGLLDLGSAAGGRYELYFVYSLEREVQVVDVVRRTFIFGGVALVVLVAMVAWVVTRQVVAPVRQAALTAEQLASGRLDRRMRVRGEDELARLGRAFNEMAASLERQIHQLEELSRVQRRFVSDVSHELRTPLTTLRMAGEVMYEARHTFEPALGRSAELLQAQLDRFEALLADLLEVSRFDAGAAVLDTEAVDLSEIAQRVVDDLRPLGQRHGASVRLVAGRGSTVAEVDPRRVERIVRNLVGNAIEHSEGAPVEVRMAGDEEAVAIAVRDHGVGLRQGDLGMVFNRFWRADPARARTTGGTGLGLAIALEDAHLHGGWLQVWGEPTRGANFRLTLPRRAGDPLTGSPLPLVPSDAARGAVAVAATSDGTAVVAAVVGMAAMSGELDGVPTSRTGRGTS